MIQHKNNMNNGKSELHSMEKNYFYFKRTILYQAAKVEVNSMPRKTQLSKNLIYKSMAVVFYCSHMDSERSLTAHSIEDIQNCADT